MLADNASATNTLSAFSRIHEFADCSDPPHPTGVHHDNSVAFRNEFADSIRYRNQLFRWNLAEVVSGIFPDNYLQLFMSLS